MTMNARDEILGRIREALQVAAPRPGAHDSNHSAKLPLPGPEDFRKVVPVVSPVYEEQRSLFAKYSEMLKTEFKVVSTIEAAAEEIRQLAAAGQWQRIATHHSPVTDSVCKNLGTALFYTDKPYAVADLEVCDAGVTSCECLVAQTGSVMISSRSCGGRALSVLPPHHIVVATRDQLLPDLSAAYALMRKKYEGNFPSCMSFITGPSRTGDIERILVLGAHGPKRLTVLLIG
jgi:L-lactate dehydrogenase complex protein LldG